MTVTVGELNTVGGDEIGRDTGGAGTANSVPSTESVVGFYVEDDAPEIPDALHKSVFETGYSTAETGFGLTIVKQTAEAHGWDVSVREGEIGGTRFEFIGVELVE